MCILIRAYSQVNTYLYYRCNGYSSKNAIRRIDSAKKKRKKIKKNGIITKFISRTTYLKNKIIKKKKFIYPLIFHEFNKNL